MLDRYEVLSTNTLAGLHWLTALRGDFDDLPKFTDDKAAHYRAEAALAGVQA